MPGYMISNEIDIFFRWLQIREDNGYSRTFTLQQLRADADHSSLLKRLLRGEKPLPEAPPRAYSYPWCDLITYGVAYPFEVYESKMFPGMLCIEQSVWKILESPAVDTWVVTYRTPDVDKIRRAPATSFGTSRAADMEEYLKDSDSRWYVCRGVDPRHPDIPGWVISRITSDTK